MAKEADFPADMAHARQSEGINVIFDQESSVSSRSRSPSRGSSDSSDRRRRDHHSRRENHRRRYRSSSSSGGSSSPRPRSRSHPRCHRRSSRCRCDNHYNRSRRYRAHSRSVSRSPSTNRYSHRRRYRSPSRSTSPSSWSRNRRQENKNRSRVSKSRSPARPASLSLQDKRELLKAAKENAEKLLGVEKIELPESVKPILPEQTSASREASPEPMMRQSDDEEPDMSSPSTSPKRKIISFSINNSVAKPTVAPPCPKVTARADSYESRRPYGHWIPVRSVPASRARKHTPHTKSH